VSLGDLALIVAAGLAGPLLAASRRAFVPVVVGEVVAGVILGRSGLDVIHADNATVSFLAEAGFAMLMLTVGMHIPLRDRRLRRASAPSARTCSPAEQSPYPRRQACPRHRSHPKATPMRFSRRSSRRRANTSREGVHERGSIQRGGDG
jgi:Sodium/hydrogen exchanger family